ncbi:MAG: aminotransferase class I/II-fold pyridoxal phosphate-dependent enzyme [Treponema sp.]|nr:aminotransferase class I/II-fold pyridoxal phosphate-dependent enzyme [Treponema sp.]MCL2252448.1 aminotransferase class I/II-fold pyridoxal phosphate-dependent enzyme [Treponema sp.]
MKHYSQMSKTELTALKKELEEAFSVYKKAGRKLNMTRGVPSDEQLALCNEMLTCLSAEDYKAANGIDCRNYGGLDGIPEMKKIFADLLELTVDEVIVSGNSSLALMFDNVAVNMSHGVRDGLPWRRQGQVKFLCPSPGYDRHFTICNYFHIEMIPVAIGQDGPDMDTVEKMVSSDPMIKGIWCVPKYSNPTGIIYSDETVKRFSKLKPAADDFRIYWDNAYAFHDLDDNKSIPNIIRLCEENGNPNMVYVFASFSKVSFAGASVTCMASSKSNCEYIRKRLTAQTIGPDKLNQLRHARFFKDVQGVWKHMKKHADILKPKFKLVFDTLANELGDFGVAQWTTPSGGYFVSFDSLDGCAKRIVALCAEAGVALTPAGATFPNGNDPKDRNIRIAPTCPPLAELGEALKIFCVAVKLASTEKLLAD